jgi:hypothetical protein
MVDEDSTRTLSRVRVKDARETNDGSESEREWWSSTIQRVQLLLRARLDLKRRSD